MAFGGEVFKEYTLEGPIDVKEHVNTGKERGVLVVVAADGSRMQNFSTGDEHIIAVTEKRTRHEMDALVALFKEMSQ